MGYTAGMKELIKRVEATRPERVAMARRGENYPALSLEEREQVLTNTIRIIRKRGAGR